MPAKRDFYSILGVSKDATEDDLKKAYKKVAMKHHPDRPNGNAEKFKEASEAFEVLSDGNKRAVYDRYGEDGLKGGPPPDAAGGNPFGAGGFPGGFSAGGPGQTFSFSSSGGNPFGGAGGGFRDPRDLFSSLFGDLGGGGMGGGGFGGFEDAMPRRSATAQSGRQTPTEPETATEITKPLPVSLEDLYSGATKRMKISRRTLDGSTEDKILEVTIRAGYKAGTKIKFRAAGNEEVKNGSVVSQDVAFVIEEKPHATYKREGDDAVYTLHVPLVDALSGPTAPATSRKTITTLDKRSVAVTIPYPSSSGGAPLRPGQDIRVANEGFPITRANSPKKRGDLIVRIAVDFPQRLTAVQADAVRKALS